MHLRRFVELALGLQLCLPAVAQVCGNGQLQLQHDVLPANPAGTTAQFAAIQGVGVGDRAAVVFDLRGYPGPIRVERGGILFGAQCLLGGAQAASARLEIYDGLTILPSGQAVPGPRVYQGQPLSLQPDTLTSSAIGAQNVTVNSGLLVVAFEMTANPNLPGLCQSGFASDTTLPAGSPCNTRPGINLIFDVVTQTWWDIASFQISGVNFCGAAFNGNWVIRACVTLPPGSYAGTQEGFELRTGINGQVPNLDVAKAGTGGDVLAIELDSPNGAFLGSFAILAVDLFLTRGPAPVPFFPGSSVGPNPAVAGPYLLGGVVPINLTLPGNSFGLTYMFQAATLSLSAQNGLYATSDAHVIWGY